MPRPKGSKNKPKTGNGSSTDGTLDNGVSAGVAGLPVGGTELVVAPAGTFGARMQWCYTSFKREQVESIQRSPGVVHVVGEEVAPSTQRVHYQGVVRFPRAISFQQLRLLAPDAHFEPCRNWTASVKYCRKGGKMIYDNGPRSSREENEAVWDYVLRELNRDPTAETCRRLAQEHPRFWIMWGRRVKDWMGDAFFTPSSFILPNFSLPPS